MNVKFKGILKFAGTVKNQKFDTFWRRKSRECRYRVNYGRKLKLYGRRRV